MSKSYDKLEWLLLILIIFGPRLIKLDLFLTADEPLFLEHAQKFAQAWATGDFHLTTGIGYPGVTVAAWAAPVINLAQTEMEQYALGRAATATLTGILLLLLYSLSRQLLGRWPALIGVGLLALDPFMLGYSRLFHIAAPLALFMTLAGVSLLLWLHTERWLGLALCGGFTGLALLTKSTALLLAPMLAVVILTWAVSTGRWRNLSWWGQKLGGVVLLSLISSTLFFLLWPAMWVDPIATLSLTFGKLFTDQEAGAGNLGLFWFGHFVEDPGPAFYPVAFLLKSTPWLLAGLILSAYYIFRGQGSGVRGQQLAVSGQRLTASGQRSDVSRQPSAAGDQVTEAHLQSPISNLPPPTPILHSSFSILNSTALWLFALTYLVLMTIASKKSVRYMLPAFPTFYLLTGLAFSHTFFKLRQIKYFNLIPNFPKSSSITQPSNAFPPPPSNYPTTQSPNHPISQSPNLPISILMIILSLSLTLLYHPYYLTYYNPLLLGWRWAPQTILVGWGEGLDDAARYLNAQPVQTVAAWYEWLFPLLYKGDVEAVVPQENLITAAAAVLYINQVQRDIPSPNIIHYFRTRRQPAHTVRLNGIDYAWVYPGPIAGFEPPPAPPIALSGDFGGEARLLGYDLGPQSPTSGESLIVTLQWQVLAPPSGPRFVYLRLVDSQGHIWASADSPPVMGLWPVERWQPGMFIEDAHELPVPPGTPPGRYRLEVGSYNPDTGQTLAASGQPVGQGGGLLLGEVDVNWQTRTETVIDLSHQTDTALSNRVHLIGYDSPPPQAASGDLLPVRLIWQRSDAWFQFGDPTENTVVFIWSRAGASQAEQIDPLPLPVEQWGRGAVLRSQHEVIVPPTLSAGQYNLLIGLHEGQQLIGEPFSLGMVEVVTPPHEFDLPSAATPPDGPAQLTVAPDHTVSLAGYSDTLSESTLDLQLFWQTNAPLTGRYKVFAQLLDASNRLVAQSDSIPAAGQRPTTGWLPGEMIADTHHLSLPPDLPADQPYRLIAGLYDPASGQRLSLTDNTGDAIRVAAITLNGGNK
ncbi:MAG: glycosyltransferase family 39 protein [Anaerolineaceae bacterium]|nr:glycosyltransferase family 39 protein [Anaerolineaceae bacterium]